MRGQIGGTGADRRRTALQAAGGLVALVGLTVFFNIASKDLREAATTAGTLLAALAAAYAAYQAKESASNSSAAALASRRALALHQQTEPLIYLAPENGQDEKEWVWVIYVNVLIGDQHPIMRDVRMNWIVAGQPYVATTDVINGHRHDTWTPNARLGLNVTQEQVDRDLSSIELTWWDNDRLGQWRVVVSRGQTTMVEVLPVYGDSPLARDWQMSAAFAFTVSSPELVRP